MNQIEPPYASSSICHLGSATSPETIGKVIKSVMQLHRKGDRCRLKNMGLEYRHGTSTPAGGATHFEDGL
jgi:hypothetical protein